MNIKTIWLDRSGLTPALWTLLSPHRDLIEEIRGEETPYGHAVQGVAVLVTPPVWPQPDTLLDRLAQTGRAPFLVALDQVEDPMNLGQILRTCNGAGVDAVFLLKHRSVHLSQTVAQVSQGAFAWVPVLEVGNLRQWLEKLKERNIWIIGCDSGPDAKAWFAHDFTEAVTLVFGAEGKGLRELTKKTCDHLACLPMSGEITSLNVSAATAAFLYEVVRQRDLVSPSRLGD